MTTTNKYAQQCKDCGEMVLPRQGVLTNEWSNQDDEMVWVVRHSDKSICKHVEAEQAQSNANTQALERGINYIKTHGLKTDIMDGNVIVYDGRHGYNQVGWLLTRTGDTLYLTSRSNLDGMDMSETYTYDRSSGMSVDDLIWTMQL